MSLKKANQEHKRSELIATLNKEIADQDTIIETLRKLISNEDLADKEIIKALTKGPPKIRVETREELKIEIKKLKAQLAKVSTKKDEVSNKNIENPGLLEERRNSVDTQISVRTEFNENFLQQIEQFKKENEDLRLNLKSQQVVIQRYDEEIEEKLQEINELRLIKTDFLVLTKKYETLQKENEKIKEIENKKFVMTFDKEMRLEELEILNRTQQGKLNIVEKNVGFELNNLKQQMEDLDRKNAEVQAENDKMLIKHNELLQKNKGLTETITKSKYELEILRKEKELNEQKHENVINSLRNSLEKLENELNSLHSDKEELKQALFSQKAENKALLEENQELKIQNLQIKESLRQNIATNNNFTPKNLEESAFILQEDRDEKPQKLMKTSQISEKRPKEREIPAEVLEENRFLKRKLKEFMIKHVEHTEKIDALELELRLKQRKESVAFIKARQHERQTQKIQNMQEQLNELEMKQNLKSFNRMDSNLSNISRNLQKTSKIELDSNLSYSNFSISRMDSKISTPIKSEGLLETDSDLTSENQELKRMLKSKQQEELDMKMRIEKLERENKKDVKKISKKDAGTAENEKRIRELAEKISNIDLNNSDFSNKSSVARNSVMDSNVSYMDSNIESVLSGAKNEEEKLETDSNISGFIKK